MDLLLQSPQCAFALCVLCFSHVRICAFVGLRVRVCLFLCSYTSVVIYVVYLIGLSPTPMLWAVMKLNTVHFIFERSLSKHILSSVLQLALSCIDRALSGNCSLFVSGALILSFFKIFFSFGVFVCVCSSAFSLFQEPKSECILLWFSTKTQYVSSLPVRPSFWLPPARYANTCTFAPHTETCSQGKNPVVALSLWAVMSCCQFSEKYWTVIAVYPNRLGQCVTKARLSCSWGFQLFFPHSQLNQIFTACLY